MEGNLIVAAVLWLSLVSVDDTWSAFGLRRYQPGEARQTFRGSRPTPHLPDHAAARLKVRAANHTENTANTVRLTTASVVR